MRSSARYVADSFIWTTISKVLNAVLKFISIPLLLAYFGKESYGLITLAVAVNAYMQLLNMGMNTGAVKFFSQWIVIKDYDRIDRVARTNLSFYTVIGIINCIVLLLLAWKGQGIFKISTEEFATFRYLLYILAGVSIVNWSTFAFTQLLIADEKMAFTQQVLSFRNIMNIVLVILTIQFKWSILQYFLYDSIVNMLVVVPYYVLTKKQKLIKSVIPAFYWEDFSVVFKYGLAIFAMSIFQFTASQSRPLILGMFATDSTASMLADYRVVEVFPIFILSIGGALISILLPKTSQAIQRNDRKSIEKIAYEGTKYTSILVAVMCFPIILNAENLLTLYVGESYRHLGIWLSLWVFTLTLSLHNSPVSSLVLATGKTRMLVYSSAIACIVSMVINAVLTNRYGVGSAVIGYLMYIVIQVLFYYLYFNNKVLELQSWRVFKSFFQPTLIANFVFGIVSLLNLLQLNNMFMIIVKTTSWVLLFFVSLYLFKLIRIDELKNILNKTK